MKWTKALNQSRTHRAIREIRDDPSSYEGEPNIVLRDPKFPSPKLFRAIDHCAWERIPLKQADDFDDWEPDGLLWFEITEKPSGLSPKRCDE